MSGWTAKEDAALALFVERGYSATRIGILLGRSRNSVIGRSHRLKKPCRSKISAGKKGRFSAAEDTVIATMSKEGKSGSQIASILGREIHSVVHRARLIGVPLHAKSGPEKKVKPVAIRKNAFSVVAIAAKKESRAKDPEFNHVTPVIAVEPLMVALVDLKPFMCRYPVGDPHDKDFGFCGHPKEEGAYCWGHAAICYTPPEQRRRAAA